MSGPSAITRRHLDRLALIYLRQSTPMQVREHRESTYEVYVRSFPAPGGGKWQISKDGGQIAKWRRDGRELFYYAPDGRLMAVPIAGDAALDVGAAVPLFQPRLLSAQGGIGFRAQYDVARDGQRFLLNVPREGDAPASITVVLNWAAALKK